MQKKILVLGATGMLGSYFIKCSFLESFQVFTHSKSGFAQFTFDLCDKQGLMKMLIEIEPDFIINFTGLTDVDFCEQYPNIAYQCNTKIIENLSSCIKNLEINTKLVHISTDQVYDGVGPHEENNVTIKNYYAFSKYSGEIAASKINSLIFRTNFFGISNHPSRRSFSDWIYNSLINRTEIKVFNDVKFNPLSMGTLCELLGKSLDSNISGVYNLGSTNGMTKAEFAIYFAKKLKMNSDIFSNISIKEFQSLKAYRPRDMISNISSFERDFEIKLPKLEEEINSVVQEYLDENQ